MSVVFGCRSVFIIGLLLVVGASAQSEVDTGKEGHCK